MSLDFTTQMDEALGELGASLREQAARDNVAIFLVGGACRDLLLGKPVTDWDFVLNTDVVSFARSLALPDLTCFMLHQRFQVVRLLYRGIVADLSEISRLEEDLRRRDLSINALAWDCQLRRLHDCGSGLKDLKRKLIRATSRQVLRDDPLRLLRAVRFCAQLGFKLESGTRTWITELGSRLKSVAAERVRDEYFKILDNAGSAAYLKTLLQLGLMPPKYFPRTESRGRKLIARLEKALRQDSGEGLPGAAGILGAPPLCAGRNRLQHFKLSLLHPKAAALKLSRHEILYHRALKAGRTAVETLLPRGLTPLTAYRFCRKYPQVIPELALYHYLSHPDARGLSQSLELLRYWEAYKIKPRWLPPPKKIMAKLQLKPGAHIGKITAYLEQQAALGRIATEAGALEAARKYLRYLPQS